MNTFFCGCGSRLHFENSGCLACGSAVGYLPDENRMAALEPGDNGLWKATGHSRAPDRLWRMCRNYELESVCNWMTPADSGDLFCTACLLNRTIPNLGVEGNRELWGKLELAKRRLVYTLLRLELPVVSRFRDPERGLLFDFLADDKIEFAEGQKVFTGHSSGVITINVAEADDAVREKMRLNLREVYRTLLGHFRHESGHYYWDQLVVGHPGIDQARAVFGDEREDYAAALQRHYSSGAPANWQNSYVTPYAAAHPWEDWAETWAHYLHIMDTLETAAAQGLAIGCEGRNRVLSNTFGRDFGEILEDWHALRLVLNSLNRSMGMGDAYPFVISASVAAKLTFIHNWISEATREFRATPAGVT